MAEILVVEVVEKKTTVLSLDNGNATASPYTRW